MLNMIDTQDKLKNFSEQQLIREMQQPSGSAPQFMVLGEIERRKRMRADMQKQQGLMQPTVAQEAVSAAGVPQQGIAQVAQSLAPKTDMTQNTGVPSAQAARLPAQPNQPQRMAGGGVLRLQTGGTISAIANLKVNYPDIYEEYKDDPEALAMAAEYFSFPATDSERTGLESLEAPYVDPYGPQGLAQRTVAAEVGNQARMASEAAQQREIDRMLEINAPLGSGRRGAPLDAAARRRIADEDMAMARPVPRNDFRTFPVEMPLTRDERILAEAQAAIKRYSTGAGRDAAGNLLPVAPDYELTEAIEQQKRDEADELFFKAGMFDRVAPENVAAQPRRSELEAGLAAEDLRQRIAQEDAAMAMPIPQSDAAAASLQDQLLGLGFTGGDIDPSPFGIAATAASKPLSYDDLVAKAKAGSPVTESDLIASVEAGLLNDNQAADINAMIDDSSYTPSAQEQRISNLERTNRMPPSGPTNPDLLGSKIIRNVKDYTAGVFGGRTIAEQDAIDAERAEETAAFAQSKALEVPVGSMVERTTAAQEEFDQRPDTQDVKPAAEQKRIDAALKTITDPAAMPPPVQPRTGTRTGKKSGILAEKNKMDQDKWLALAQAGLTLMSTGDFGKAGSAGLAALRESEKADREERKLDADLLLREAQLAKANRAPAAKAIPAAYLTDLRKQKEAIQLQLASLRPPEEGGLFSSGSDPDAAARIRLENELAGLNERINRMYAQYNLGVSPPSNRRKTV